MQQRSNFQRVIVNHQLQFVHHKANLCKLFVSTNTLTFQVPLHWWTKNFSFCIYHSRSTIVVTCQPLNGWHFINYFKLLIFFTYMIITFMPFSYEINKKFPTGWENVVLKFDGKKVSLRQNKSGRQLCHWKKLVSTHNAHD